MDGPEINLPEALIDLAAAIKSDTEETDWSLGEFTEASLDYLVIGAYWSLTEWHAGQHSTEYAALSALGSIFSPGMTMPPIDGEESEYAAYELCGKWFESRQLEAKPALDTDELDRARAAKSMLGALQTREWAENEAKKLAKPEGGQMNYTKGPLEIIKYPTPDYDGQFGIFAENSNKSIAIVKGENAEANAKHIVKCVNTHDELVSALKEMTETFSGVGDKAHWPSDHITRTSIARARVAIDNAERTA